MKTQRTYQPLFIFLMLQALLALYTRSSLAYAAECSGDLCTQNLKPIIVLDNSLATLKGRGAMIEKHRQLLESVFASFLNNPSQLLIAYTPQQAPTVTFSQEFLCAYRHTGRETFIHFDSIFNVDDYRRLAANEFYHFQVSELKKVKRIIPLHLRFN